MSPIPTRYPEQDTPRLKKIEISKKIFWIKKTKMNASCSGHRVGTVDTFSTLRIFRIFSFFGPNFFLYLDFWGSYRLKGDINGKNTVLEQNVCIFVFPSKKFFFDISICRGRTGERGVSTVPTRYLKRMRTFSFFVQKFFVDISISRGRTSERELSAVTTQ